MTQLLRLVSGVDRSPAQRAFTARSGDQQCGAESPTSDLDLARHTRVNLFVVGADDAVVRLVTALWRTLVTPIVVRHRDEPLRLSPTSRPIGTIVLYDVETLTHEEQRALYHWVGTGNGRSRVVSTASRCLLPLVEAGAFHEDLYYRLNVVTIDLTSPVAR